MRRYPKYKDTGIEWIGEIPEEWGINKVKDLSKYSNIPISIDELKEMGNPYYPFYICQS